MKKIVIFSALILLILAIGGYFIFSSEKLTEYESLVKSSCIKSGGEFKKIYTAAQQDELQCGKADPFSLLYTDQAPEFVYGCDCGVSMCWDDKEDACIGSSI